MSNDINTDMIERAGELIEYWTGTMHERILRRDLDHNDLEALKYHMDLAYREMRLQEEREEPDLD